MHNCKVDTSFPHINLSIIPLDFSSPKIEAINIAYAQKKIICQRDIAAWWLRDDLNDIRGSSIRINWTSGRKGKNTMPIHYHPNQNAMV